MEVPSGQVPLNGRLVGAQDEHIDVGVFAALVSQMQIDGPAAGKPPTTRQAAELTGDLRG